LICCVMHMQSDGPPIVTFLKPFFFSGNSDTTARHVVIDQLLSEVNNSE